MRRLVAYGTGENGTVTDRCYTAGATLESFRGEPATLVSCTRPTVPGKSGKIMVKKGNSDIAGEYYANGFGLRVVVERDDLPRGWTIWTSLNEVDHIVPPSGPCATCGKGRHQEDKTDTA